MKRTALVRFFGCLAVLMAVCCFAASEEARNIAAECRYSWTKGSFLNEGDLYNGNYSYYWQSVNSRDNWLEVTLPEGETCSGVQIKWGEINKTWCIEVQENGEWVRVSGKLVNDDRREAKEDMLEKHPSLKRMYSADDDNTQVLYIEDGTATFSSFTAAPEVITF